MRRNTTTTRTLNGLIAIAAGMTLTGCGDSELRRAMADIIDQREVGAAQMASAYRAFEAELTEELMKEWGATPDGGCPEPEDLPPGWSWDADEHAGAERNRRETWMRNMPAYHCRCVQNTISDENNRASIASAIAALPPDTLFQDERAGLAELTEEELPLAAPILRASADRFSAERAQARIDRWKNRRYGDDTGPGWQDAANQPERDRPLASCASF